MKTFLAIIFLLLAQGKCQLPSSFKVCSRHSPNLANCVKDAIEHIQPYLKTGDFGHGFKVEGLEPLRIEDIIIKKSSFDVDLRKIRAFNVSKFKVDKLRINMENDNVDIIISIKNLEAQGDYKMNILLGLAHIKGEGKFKIGFDEIKIHLRLIVAHYWKNGEDYIRFSSTPTRVNKIGKFKIQISDFFKTDKLLNDVTEALINENVHLFLDDIVPKIEKTVSNTVLRSANQVVERVPFRFIYTY